MAPTEQKSEVPAEYPVTIGQCLGDCQLLQVLGTGASGLTLKAHHQTLDVPVALKVLPPPRDDAERHLVQQVWQAAEQLTRLNHPHVVRLWDFAAEATPPYLVLELVDGETLQELMQRYDRIPLSILLPICRQVIEGLAAAARLGVVHQALNPQTILVTRAGGAAKVSGLGLGPLATCRRLSEPLAAPLAFLAPEQLATDPVDRDVRTDQFALGATFYYALTGQLAFSGQSRGQLTRQHALIPPQPIEALRPDLPAALASFIMRLLAMEPTARFASWNEVLLALDDAATAAHQAALIPLEPGKVSEPEVRARGRQFLKEAFEAQRAGQTTTARRLLRASLEVDPRQATAWYWLARLSEKPSEVLGYLEQALRVDPNHPEARQYIQEQRLSAADYAARSSNRAEARQLLLALVQQEPRHVEGLLALAGVADSPAEAMGYLQRVLEFHPDNDKARAGLEWLREQIPFKDSTWTCPFCQSTHDHQQRQCSTCGALVRWEQIEEVMTHVSCNTTQISALLHQRQQARPRKPQAEDQQVLALAHLNLHQPRQALRYLKAAIELEPEDEELQRQVEQVTRYVANQDRLGNRPRVLLIEDDLAIAEWLTLILEDEGYDVAAFANGDEALASLQQQVPDLILLDVSLPGHSDQQIRKRLRRVPGARQVPLLFVSEQEGLFARLWRRFQGTTHHVPRPADPYLLVALVKQLCPPAAAVKQSAAAR